MKIKVTFAFIILMVVRLSSSYSQVKTIKHRQLPGYIKYDTVVLYDVWIKTAREEAKQLDKIDKLERKLKNVTEILHKKKKLSTKAIQALNELDSLKASNDSLRLEISNNIRVENKQQQQRLKLLQERNNRLQKICRRLKIYSIGSTAAVVIIILVII